MKRHARWITPIGILLFGGGLVAVLVGTRPRIEATEHEVVAPIVRVRSVSPETVRFIVNAQGTVMPRTQSDLVPQVSGEVIWVSNALAAGGFFEAGEPLLRIDPVDYEADLESARAAVARARSEASRARKELDRQRLLANRSVASEARIDDTVNNDHVAQAVLREAEAREGRAERDLSRTELRAPYAGRVRSENVDPGQFVNRGNPVAKLYAVDYAEVRLPIPDRELRYLDLPLHYRGEETPPREVARPSAAEPGVEEAASTQEQDESAESAPPGPAVTLRAEFAGSEHAWNGRIVRTEGEIDPRSRMVTAVARIDDPYGPSPRGDRPPLAVGLYVRAEIEGREVHDAFVLPRSALQDPDHVLVVDAEDRLRVRKVEVLRQEPEHVVIASGLSQGERVCVSAMPGAVDGMLVRTAQVGAALAGVKP